MSISMDAMCANCGKRYGEHFGMQCALYNPNQLFKESAMKQRWVVYHTKGDRKPYRYGTVTDIQAESAQEAEQFWRSNYPSPMPRWPFLANTALPNPIYEFLAAEPYDDSMKAEGEWTGVKGFPFNASRVAVLNRKLPGEVPAPITSGPRKPVPQVPAEVWNDKPVDADKAWAAVVAMSKGEGGSV